MQAGGMKEGMSATVNRKRILYFQMRMRMSWFESWNQYQECYPRYMILWKTLNWQPWMDTSFERFLVEEINVFGKIKQKSQK